MKLNEICSKGKSSLRQKDVINDGPYSVYGASGVVGTTSDYQNEIPYVAVIKDGAGVGRASACEPMTSVLGTMQALIPNPNVERDYLLYLVRSLRLGEGFSGSTIPHIYFKDYGKIEVPLPSLEAQKRIVSQLGLIEAQIEQAEAQTTQLDQLVKSRFVKMFDNSCTRVKLSEVCRTYNGDRGKNYPSGNDRVDEGVPFVNAGHLMDGKVSFEKMDYITRERYRLLSGGKIEKGDILYCLRGSLGKCGVADFNEGTIASSMMIIRPDSSKVLTQYLYQVLTSADIGRQLKAVKNGSSQPNLSAKNVTQYLIPLPSIDLQQEFAAFVSQVDKSRFVRDHEMNFRCERFTLSWSTIA